MKNKTILIIAGILVVVLLFSTIMEFRSTTNAVEGSEKEIRVGWIGALSGDVAIVGLENLKGVELAVDEFNAEGNEIKLIIQDDQYNERLSNRFKTEKG